MKEVRALGCLFLFGVLTACTTGSRQPLPTVVTSIFPVADLVRNVVGDENIPYIVPVNANPHTYEPKPSDVAGLQNVDLFIGIHPEFDGWVLDYLPERTRIHFLASNPDESSSLPGFLPEAVGYSGGTDDDSEHGQNPHVWLSVPRAVEMVRDIARIIAELDSSGRSYASSAESYIRQLQILDSELKAVLEPVAGVPFIQFHPAWNYLAQDYGLRISGTIQHGHGDEPSVREFQGLVASARSANVEVVVVDLNMQNRSVEALVREIRGRIVRLDPLGDPMDPERDTYVKLMRYNGSRLAEGLRRIPVESR